MGWADKYQRGGTIEPENNFGSDLYTRMINTVETFGGSAIGDAVEGISPKAADWLEKYSAGMIPHTSEEMLEANRGSGANKFKQAGDAANSISLGIATGGLAKMAAPYLSKLGKKAIKPVKETLKDLPINQPNIKPTSSDLPEYMEPYLSRYEKPISKEQEIFESFLSPERQEQRLAERTVNLNKRGEWIDKYQQGGIIEDDRGQWAHPGEVTKINSNEITMQGVDYPVLGISDTGDEKLMQPGEEYKFEGESVTEYPLQKTNKKSNFTSPNNWLDKYNTT